MFLLKPCPKKFEAGFWFFSKKSARFVASVSLFVSVVG